MPRNVKSVQAALSRTQRPEGGFNQPHGTLIQGRRAADGLENVVAALGTHRDKSSHSHYLSFVRPLSRFELDNMWRSSWLAKKIIAIPVDDMTREWREPAFEADDSGAKADAVKAEEKRLQVKHKVNLAQKWADLYGGALLIMGVRGGQDLSQPLDVNTIGRGDLRYLHVIDRWRCSGSGELVTDLEDPNFGLPEYYLITESSVRVHHSRVLRFDGDELPYFSWTQNAYWHDSRLQNVYASLLRCDQTTAAIATMVFEANVDVIKGDAIAEALDQRDGEARILKRFQLAMMMKSFNHTLLLDGSEDFQKKGNSFAELPDVMQGFYVEVTGASGIPYTRLFGQSPGGLNSTGDSDLRNYYDHVVSRREDKVTPRMDRFDQVLVRSALGTYPDDYESTWNPLWQVDDETQAQIDFQNAQRDQIYLTASVLTEGAVAADLRRRGTYPGMTDEDVQLAEELAQAPEPQPVPSVPRNKPAGPAGQV